MKGRAEILKGLVLLQGDIEILERELSKYPWDIENPLFTISIDDFTRVLKKSLNDEIDFVTLNNWANAIECRDDLDFETEKIKEIVFELANPEINGEITKERLLEIINELQAQSRF